jgi:hypothetical protein
VCSLEVPDIQSAIADVYSEDELQVLLVNPMDSYDVAYEFLGHVEVSLPTVLGGEDIYSSYPRKSGSFAPFPLQVVIDGDGIIRYVAYQYDAAAVRAVIDQILSE